MSLFAELRRRNVFRVAAAYVVASWLLIQGATVLLEGFGAPDWVPKTVGALLALGFPIALIFAWAYEVTPEGIKRESEVDRSDSITHHTGRRLDLLTLGFFVLAIGLFLTEDFWRPAVRGSAGPTMAASEATPATNSTAVAAKRTPTDDLSIAVLPFANMSPDAANEFFADGISEEILNLLAGVRDLSVASRTSAFAFRGSDNSIPDIARALGVRYVLEGSVRKAGDQVRITAQLIDSSNDRHLWSDTYDRTLEDIFGIQDEIAGAIGAALQVELLGKGGQVVSTEVMDSARYAAFLQARYQLRRRSAEDLAVALDALIEVVSAELDFARGHAVLAEAYALNGLEGTGTVSLEVGLAQGVYHAERARRLNPDLSGSYLVLGLRQSLRNQMAEAMENYNRAIVLEPDEPRPHHWRSLTYAAAGYLGPALEDIETALRLEPDNANVHGEAARIQMALGNEERALHHLDRQMALGNPAGGLRTAFYYAVEAGDLALAAQHAEALSGQVPPEHAAFYQLVLAVARGEAEIDDLTERWQAQQQRLRVGALQWALLALGRQEAFLRHVNASEKKLQGQNYQVWHARNAALRADPRFGSMMARINGGLIETLGPPPDCTMDGAAVRCGLGTTDP